MLCPVCKDKVVNGKCSFCGYVLTADELKHAAKESGSTSTLNGTTVNECKGHDDHNVNNTEYVQKKDGSYTQKTETIDLMKEKFGSAEKASKTISESVNTIVGEIVSGGKSANESFNNAHTSGTKSSSSGTYKQSTSNQNANSQNAYNQNTYNQSTYTGEEYDKKKLDSMYTLSIVFIFIFPIAGFIIAIMGMRMATTETYKKKFKTMAIILGAIWGLSFLLPVILTVVFTIISTIYELAF